MRSRSSPIRPRWRTSSARMRAGGAFLLEPGGARSLVSRTLRVMGAACGRPGVPTGSATPVEQGPRAHMGGTLPGGASYPWVSDQGDGTFRNPVIFGDYSDPDVIRV